MSWAIIVDKGWGLSPYAISDVGIISVGDELLAIDGEDIKDYNFEDVIRKVQGTVGSKVSDAVYLSHAVQGCGVVSSWGKYRVICDVYPASVQTHFDE